MEFLADHELSRCPRSLVPPPSAESRRTAGELDQNGSVSSGLMSRFGVLERAGAASAHHVQAPVRAARAGVCESFGTQGSASSQASADEAVVGDSGGQDATAEATSGWIKRVRVGKAAAEREFNPNRKSALEISIMEFVDRKEGIVVNPTVGKSFDSLDEAYDFYNLYSWESGFGVRLAKSRLNVHRMKCMQEIVCGCAILTHTIDCIRDIRSGDSEILQTTNETTVLNSIIS